MHYNKHTDGHIFTAFTWLKTAKNPDDEHKSAAEEIQETLLHSMVQLCFRPTDRRGDNIVHTQSKTWQPHISMSQQGA